MTTASQPVWAPWTTYYDPAGVGPAINTDASGDGLSVTVWLNDLTLSLPAETNVPLAGATGLAGALSVDLPSSFILVGLMVQVFGVLESTAAGTEAAVACSIGHSTQSLQWPSIVRPGAHRSGSGAADQPGSQTDPGRDPILGSDFELDCFTTPGASQPPLPPLPITLSMQARRFTADETILVTCNNLIVTLLTA